MPFAGPQGWVLHVGALAHYGKYRARFFGL